MKTVTKSILATLLLALLLGGGQALARSSTAPPSILVEVIGAGKVTGTGISCGLGQLTCAATYADATPVTLTPSAATGWTFDHWEDSCVASPCSPAPSTAGTVVTAVFTHTAGTLNYQTFSISLSADTSGDEHGYVDNGSPTTNPISCGDDDDDTTTPAATGCSVTVPQGSTVTVRETPDTSYIFNGWGGNCSGTKTYCSAYMSTDRPVSADFLSSTTNQLEVTVDGSGTVTGGGITCTSGATCDRQEPPSATITLTETPASGYAFTGWSGGDCSGLATTCTVEMSSARTVIANFDPLVPVLITVNGAGTVTGANVTCGPGPATCNGSSAPSTTIQLQATPTVAGASIAWSGCTSAASTICNVNVNTSPISVTVTFGGGSGGGGTSTFTITGNVTGDGYVTATHGATMYCTAAGGSGCIATVAQGTSVTLQAVPASGSASNFQGWTTPGIPCDSSLLLTCTFTVTSARTVEADFDGFDTTYDLTASISGSGSVSGAGLHCSFTGSAGCTSPQALNAPVTLTAAPSPGSSFSGWSGACTGTSVSCTVVMSADKNVTATFVTAPPGNEPLTIAVTGAGTVAYTGGSCKSTTSKGKTCSTSARENTSLTLKATPAAGYGFSKWSGSCTSKTATCTVKLTGPTSVEVTFVRLVLAPGKKPKVTKLKTGYRVTLSFIASQPGRLTVTTKPNVAHLTKTIKAGAGTARLAVKKRGRYTFTLSLRSKSGTHKLRYTVKV